MGHALFLFPFAAPAFRFSLKTHPFSLEIPPQSSYPTLVGFISRGIWREVPIKMSLELTRKGSVSVRWVDQNKGGEGAMEVRRRLVARDFKGKDKDGDDLLAATPPLEAKRMLLSRAATKKTVGRSGLRK